MAKISELAKTDPAAAGAELLRQYMSCHDAWLADRDVRHPSYDTKSWRDTARDAGTLRATDEGGLGPVEIMKRGQDDEQPELTAAGNAGNGGPTPAQDSQLGTWVRGLDHATRWVPHGGQMLPGDVPAPVSRSTPSTAASQHAMAQIPGYKRLA